MPSIELRTFFVRPLNVCRIGIFVLCLFNPFLSSSQLFWGSGDSIPEKKGPRILELSVSGLPESQLTTNYGLKAVHLQIKHNYLENLKAWLMSPQGTVVRLFTNAGGNGKNMLQTVLCDTAGHSLQLEKLAPYTGCFQAQDRLGNFNRYQQAEGIWRLFIEDEAAFDQGELEYWGLEFGANVTGPENISSSLPIVEIFTLNQTIYNDFPITCLLQVNDRDQGGYFRNNDPIPGFRGYADIKIRGMHSAFFPQPPYKIKLLGETKADTAVSLMGMPEENDWILMSTYNDKSFVRNPIMHDLFSKMGHYSPRNRFCELYINDVYQGIYSFYEQIRRTKNRLNISKLKASDTSGFDLTGGYIFRHDYDNGEGWLSSVAPSDCPENFAHWEYEYPDFEDIQAAQRKYLQSVVADVEKRLFSPDFKDSLKGYRSRLHIPSFIDYFIANELAWNGDGFAKSMYFWKDRDDKDSLLHAGPIWDFDWSLKRMPWVPTDLGFWNHNTYPCNNKQSTLPWHAILVSDSFFTHQLRCRWESLRESILREDILFKAIDSIGHQTLEAQSRHYTKWPTWGINVGTPELPPFPSSYQEEMDSLKATIHRRLDWLDRSIPGICKAPVDTNSPPVPVDSSSQPPVVYPNPAWEELHIKAGTELLVSVSICDYAGRLLSEIRSEEARPTMQLKLPASFKGVCFVRIQCESSVYRIPVLVQPNTP